MRDRQTDADTCGGGPGGRNGAHKKPRAITRDAAEWAEPDLNWKRRHSHCAALSIARLVQVHVVAEWQARWFNRDAPKEQGRQESGESRQRPRGCDEDEHRDNQVARSIKKFGFPTSRRWADELRDRAMQRPHLSQFNIHGQSGDGFARVSGFKSKLGRFVGDGNHKPNRVLSIGDAHAEHAGTPEVFAVLQ